MDARRGAPNAVLYRSQLAPFVPLAELLGVTAGLENGFAELTGQDERPRIYAARSLSIGLHR
jgi:hypothetical protein